MEKQKKTKYKTARQAEIIRCIQKDEIYVNNLSNGLSDILRIVLEKFAKNSNKKWLTYQSLCLLVAKLSYHGYLSLARLQTLGEEYTGILQINGSVKSELKLPNRLVRK